MTTTDDNIFYRLLIKKSGRKYLKIILQCRTGLFWKNKQVEYVSRGNEAKTDLIIRTFSYAYNLSPNQVVDVSTNYNGVSIFNAVVMEIAGLLDLYVWKKRFNRLKKEILVLHYSSGSRKETRKKFWIMTDYKGNPIIMNSALKKQFKAKRIYSKSVDSLAMDKECLWSTDDLYK